MLYIINTTCYGFFGLCCPYGQYVQRSKLVTHSGLMVTMHRKLCVPHIATCMKKCRINYGHAMVYDVRCACALCTGVFDLCHIFS